MGGSDVFVRALAWLLTYGVHSTVLLVGAWILTSRLSVEHSLIKERIWRIALLGGLATATVQTGLGLDTLGGRWQIAPAASVEVRPAVERPALEEGASPAATTRPLRLTNVPRDATPSPTSPAQPVLFETPDEPVPDDIAFGVTSLADDTATGPSPWPARVLAVWAAIAGLAVLRLALSWLALLRHIAGRSEVRLGTMGATLRRLAAAAGSRRAPRLTCSSQLSTPITTGLWRPEICVPTRALHALEPAEQEALLAHELAHALRRDPRWLGLYRLLEALLFFQPLNRLARRRLEDVAEYACDDWAVQRTGRRLPLARCLTEVAGWLVGPSPPIAAVGMATRGHRLGGRVERLLDEDRPALARPRRASVLAGLTCALVAVAVVAPGIAADRDDPSAPLDDAVPEDGADLQLDPGTRPSAPEASSTNALEEALVLLAGFRTLEAAMVSLEVEVGALREELRERGLTEYLEAEIASIERRVEGLQHMRMRWMQLLVHYLESVEARTARTDSPESGDPESPAPESTVQR